MELTPDEFAKQLLPKYYKEWVKNNGEKYFPVERELTDKASRLGYLDKDDLKKITMVLGNSHNRRGKMDRANSNDEVIQATKEAISNLDKPVKAFQCINRIREWGLAYCSKTLRCICPRRYGALDSKIGKCVDRHYFLSSDEATRYAEFLDFCTQLRVKVTVPGPRNGDWFIADIEIALFQFAWDEDNKII